MRFSLKTAVLVMLAVGGCGLGVATKYQCAQLNKELDSAKEERSRVLRRLREPLITSPANPQTISAAWRAIVEFQDGVRLATEGLPENFAVYRGNTLIFSESSEIDRSFPLEFSRNPLSLVPYIFIVNPSGDGKFFRIGPFDDAFTIPFIEIKGEQLACKFKRTKDQFELAVNAPFDSNLLSNLEVALTKSGQYHGLFKTYYLPPPTQK